MDIRQAPSSPQNRYVIPSKTASSHYGSPPSSPPPTSPLPLPPISSSSTRSLNSSTPLPRLTRLQSSLSGIQTLVSPPRSLHNRSSAALTPTDGLSHSQEPAKKVGLLGPFQRTVPKYSCQLTTDNIVHCDGLDRPQLSSKEVCDDVAIMADRLSQSPNRTPSQKRATMRKRRSKKPPRKAIARSALHVPSTETLKSPVAEHDVIFLERASRPTPPLFDEFLTSLPPWHNSRNSRPARGEKSRELIHGKKRKIAPTMPTNGHGKSALSAAYCPEDAYEEISFRPVTNLEQYRDENATTPPGLENSTNVISEADSRIRAWHTVYKRHMWLALTIIFVTLATGGVVIGILWKLTRT